MPSPITGLNEGEVCFSNAIVSWNPVLSDEACDPLSYKVSSSGGEEMRLNETTYFVTGLTENTLYNVTVRSSNSAGEGKPGMHLLRTAMKRKYNVNNGTCMYIHVLASITCLCNDRQHHCNIF